MNERRGEDRRGGIDRRSALDRRVDVRQGAFAISRSELHLALVVLGLGDQPDRLITRSVVWRKEAIALESEQGVRELTGAFRKLVDEERLAGAVARVALNGELCVTRVVAGLASDVRRELTELHERSQLYRSLGPGPKTTAEASVPLDARHEHALLSVANARAVELIAEIAEQVGLKLERVESSLVALSRLVGHKADKDDSATILLELDDHSAEIGIAYRGRLILDYRPAGQTSPDHVAQLLEQHLERLERCCQRHLGLATCRLEQVYIAGKKDAAEAALERLRASSGLRVELLRPAGPLLPWQSSSVEGEEEFAGAIGTALGACESNDLLPSPNLMDQLIAARRAPLKPILLKTAIPVAAVLLVSLCVWLFNWHTRSRLQAMRGDLDGLLPMAGRAKELELTILAAVDKVAQLRDLSSALPPTQWQQVLERVRTSTPDDVWLERVAVQDGLTASVAGASYTETGIYDFVQYLKNVPEIDQVALQGTGLAQSSSAVATSFDVVLTLKNASTPPVEDATRE